MYKKNLIKQSRSNDGHTTKREQERRREKREEKCILIKKTILIKT
jgi:hypothetical protein